jgi:protein ImuB
MLWFALYLPRLPLEAWLVATPPPAEGAPARPCCVVEARRVVQADAVASALGIEPGMSAASAAALVSGEGGLQVFARDAGREADQVRRLALALACFTPSVVLQHDGVLLEVSASLRLFGGAAALWRAVGVAARSNGVHSLRIRAAPTAMAAAVLARAEPSSVARGAIVPPASAGRRDAAAWTASIHQRLDALPLDAAAAAWGVEPRLLDLLQGVGCRTLGDVRMLPRAGTQRRGAAALLEAIARAHGQVPDPQAWFEPPHHFEMGLELLHRADDAAMLVFATQRLVQPLAGWLAQQWRAATRLTLVLRHETSLRHAQPDTQLKLALADPTRDAEQTLLMLRERLQRLTLAAPVYALTLRLDESVSHAGRATALWHEAGAGHGEQARALFDRLAARLGPERVQRPQGVADHRPERATTWTPVAQAPARKGPAPTAPVEPAAPLRPTWLLDAPQPLAEDAALGRPLHQGQPLTLLTRAERIEAGWFDGAMVSRDYHVAQAADLRWLWVYRERRGAQSRWFLHGLFG